MPQISCISPRAKPDRSKGGAQQVKHAVRWGCHEDTNTRALSLDTQQNKESDKEGDTITVDTGAEVADSALGTQVAAHQLHRSDIYKLINRYENGQRYPGYGEYWVPNDETQNELLDITHHLYCLLLDGKLFLAPIGDSPQRVLDVGTGTGIWAMEFADQYPGAQVIGFDLSPVYPGRAMPNVSFEMSDACDPHWGYEKDSFDFIHVRSLCGCVADWARFYEQVLVHLAPGGWYQQIEMSVTLTSDDGSVTKDSPLDRWGKITLEAGDAMGKDFRIHEQVKGYLDAAGFEDVVEQSYKLPIGSWSVDPHLREIGRWNEVRWRQGIEGWSLDLFTRILGWSPLMVRIHLSKMRMALNDRKIHAYHIVNVVYGRKPARKDQALGE